MKPQPITAEEARKIANAVWLARHDNALNTAYEEIRKAANEGKREAYCLERLTMQGCGELRAAGYSVEESDHQFDGYTAKITW